ncbi:hypothetical protein ACNFR7_10190 [Streptomyces sp. RM1]
MADQSEAQTWSGRARLGAIEPPPGAPAGTVRMVTVDFSGQPYVTRHVPTPEELARRE